MIVAKCFSDNNVSKFSLQTSVGAEGLGGGSLVLTSLPVSSRGPTVPCLSLQTLFSLVYKTEGFLLASRRGSGDPLLSCPLMSTPPLSLPLLPGEDEG